MPCYHMGLSKQNCCAGTTVKGAVDDLDLVIKTLEENGFTDRFYIHCDGALFGLMIPFVKKVIFRFSMLPHLSSIKPYAVPLQNYLDGTIF